MKWIDEVRGGDSLREVARRVGAHQATLNRQINLDMLTFEMVRDISRAYERAVLSDLISTGHLSISDAGINDIDTALHASTDAQLVAEVGRRLGVTSSTLFDAPISEAITAAGNVIKGEFGGVGGSEETDADDEPAAAKTRSRDRGEDPQDL